MAEGVRRYVDKPRPPRVTHAARYEPGSVEDLLEVARRADGDAAVAEVPELGVAVVRHLIVPDGHPMHDDYEVVEAGLVYSEAYDLLYESDPKAFEREHRIADGEEA